MDTYRERHREEFKKKVREQVENLLLIRDKLRSKIVDDDIEFLDLRDIAEEINKCGNEVKYPTHYGEPEKNFGEAWASEFTDEERLLLRLAWASKGNLDLGNKSYDYGRVTLCDIRRKELSRDSPGFGRWYKTEREVYAQIICCYFLRTSFGIKISERDGVYVYEIRPKESNSKICGMEDNSSFEIPDLKYPRTFWQCLEKMHIEECDLCMNDDN